jgi:hypothetical protein
VGTPELVPKNVISTLLRLIEQFSFYFTVNFPVQNADFLIVPRMLLLLRQSPVKSKTRLKEDGVIGVVFTGFFALGLVLVTKIPSNVDLFHILSCVLGTYFSYHFDFEITLL